MKQAVLISINPKWCELIASGKKTIEVRKTKPKLLPPFKCYIYQTLPKHGDWNERDGRVIAEFICDWCEPFQPRRADFAELSLGSLVPPRELYEYAKGKTLYGWHITDLKLYAEPKEISEFKRWNRTERTAPCAHVYALYSPCESCTECNLKRGPQSWCYVEEVDECRHTCYNCYYGGDGEEIDDYGHCWKHNGEPDFEQPDKYIGCEEWMRKLFCQEQAVCVDDSVCCVAHLADDRVLDCPYESLEDRLKSDYPCQDYRERDR